MKRSALAVAFLLSCAPARGLAPCATCTAPSFAGAFRSFPSLAVTDVVAADFNGDGVPDLATANRTNGVAVRLGKGTGGFEDAVVRASSDVSYLVAADVNGDGKMDVVAAGASVSVFLGNGDGTLQAPIEFAPEFYGYRALSTGDFNGDGIPDLVAGVLFGAAHVFLGNGDGTFTESSVLGTGTDTVRSFALADFDGDGRLDFAAATEPGGGLAVFLGDGTGHFVALPISSFHSTAGSLAVGDFNRDGVPDLVSGQFNDVVILLGSGDGTFTPGATYSGGNGPNFVATADLRHVGVLDILFATEQDGTITVLNGNGDGTFGSPAVTNAGDGFGRFALADFDGNTSPDVAVVSFDLVEVIPSTTGGAFPAPPGFPTGNVIGPMAVAELTGDTFADVAVALGGNLAPGTPGILSVLPGDGTGSFGSPVTVPLAGITYCLVSANLNADAHKDLVAGTAAGVQVILADGAGGFTTLPPFGPGFVQSIAVDDLNGDSKTDLVVAGGGGVYLGNGDGTFTAAPGGGAVTGDAAVIGDFNGDHKLDVAVTQANQVSIYLGQGDGTFTPGAVFGGPPSGDFTHLATADLDGDGKLDLVVVRFRVDDPLNVDVYFGHGDGTFEPRVQYAGGFYPVEVTTADLNGDGLPDIVVSTSLTVRAFMSHADRTFTVAEWVKPLGGTGFALGDLDGDGRSDIASAAGFPPPSLVTVMRNTFCIPSRLAVATQPSACATPGTPLAIQPVVHVVDDGDNVVCSNLTVSASIVLDTGEPGAILGGTPSVAAVNGVATFTNLSVDRPGRRYRLGFFEYADSSLGATASRTFTQGLTVDIAGPRAACASSPVTLRTGAGGYDRYDWVLDGSSISRADEVTLVGLSPGIHTLQVTVYLDGCTAVASTSLVVAPAPAAPPIVAPTSVPAGATGLTAGVAGQAGHTYLWSLSGGTILSGNGTATVTFAAGPAGTLMHLGAVDVSALGCESPESDFPIQVDFTDVPPSGPFHDAIAAIGRHGITAGCGGGAFCSQLPVTRAQIAVFLLRAEHGPAYLPPPLPPPPFDGTMFADVRGGDFAAAWIQELGVEGIAGGCGGGNFCPGDPVNRAQMAVFLLRTEHGSGYTPPPATGVFADVPVGFFAAAWIEQLAREGITARCGVGIYCPASPVTRAQMAVFLVATFDLR